MFSGDGIRVVHPLFREEGDGSIPISPLQLEVHEIAIPLAVSLNELWHSRLPKLNNQTGDNMAFAAHYKNRYYAVAIWGWPVARMLLGKGMYELRRMAIADDAPKNTASRMLRIMRLEISKKLPAIATLISYQDTGVHRGTIYKAAGWRPSAMSNGGEWSRDSRKRPSVQAETPKLRWEISVKST